MSSRYEMIVSLEREGYLGLDDLEESKLEELYEQEVEK